MWKREDDDNDEQNYHCIETKNILKQNKRHETYIHTHTKNDDNKRQMYKKKRRFNIFSMDRSFLNFLKQKCNVIM